VCVPPLDSAYDYTVGPMGKALVKTDLQIAVPPGCYGRVGEGPLPAVEVLLPV